MGDMMQDGGGEEEHVNVQQHIPFITKKIRPVSLDSFFPLMSISSHQFFENFSSSSSPPKLSYLWVANIEICDIIGLEPLKKHFKSNIKISEYFKPYKHVLFYISSMLY